MSHKKYRQASNCLNCGATVQEKFCPECGQENVELHDNFFHLVGHFLSDYFHYDSKFFKSLGYLFSKPGFLTSEYLQGRRVKYIQPLRLFFFVTIISVLVSTAYQHKFEKELLAESINVTRTIDSTTIEVGLDQLTGSEKEKVETLNAGMNNFIHDLKYVSFFLLPVYAIGFKLVYIRRKRFYVDHLIFTMHLQSFVFSLIAIVLLVPLYFYSPSYKIVSYVIVPGVVVYTILSLRYLYQQAWWKTILKAMLALLFVAAVTGIVRLCYIWIPFFF